MCHYSPVALWSSHIVVDISKKLILPQGAEAVGSKGETVDSKSPDEAAVKSLWILAVSSGSRQRNQATVHLLGGYYGPGR